MTFPANDSLNSTFLVKMLSEKNEKSMSNWIFSQNIHKSLERKESTITLRTLGDYSGDYCVDLISAQSK